MRGAAKGMPKYSPYALQNQPGSFPNLPKSRPGTLLAASRRPRAPKRRSRGAQEAPKKGQEPPKRAQKPAMCTQELPPRDPGPSKTAPGNLQDKFLARSRRKALFDRRPGRILHVFSVVRWMADMRFVLFFPIQNACRACFELQARKRKKTSKNKTLGSPKPSPDPPGTRQNRARHAQRRTKTGQEPQQTQHETENASKKHPRAKNSANMVPIGQHSIWDL